MSGVEEMSEQIDWSKAPEGCIGVFTTKLSIGYRPFFVITKRYSDYGAQAGCSGQDSEGNEYHVFEKYWDYHEKPASWSGEGLPPVGVVCEANFVGEWKRFEMRYYGEAHVVFKTAFEVQRARYDFDTCGVKFRPIRTPEQIAADEREAACEEMLEIAKSRRPDPDVYEAIATLYDAGFRKP